MTDERHVIRPEWGTTERHERFVGKPVSLLVVASNACAHEILPFVFAAARAGNHVIDCQREIGPAAVLAPVIIASEYILS